MCYGDDDADGSALMGLMFWLGCILLGGLIAVVIWRATR